MSNDWLLSTFNYNKENKSTLVFIHGFLCSAEIWNTFASSFIKDYNIYLIHLPGHTGSGEIIESIKELACKIKKELLAKKIINPHIIGHSLGGYIAGELANIKTLKSITLINSSLLKESEDKRLNREKAIRAVKISPLLFSKSIITTLFLEENRKTFDQLIISIQQNAKKIKRETIISYLEAIKNREDTTINIINTPTHFVLSKKDTTISYELVESQIKGDKNNLTLLTNSNHMSFLEEKLKVTKAIQAFFISLDQ